MNPTIKRAATGVAAIALVAGASFAASAAFSATTAGAAIDVTTGTIEVASSNNVAGGFNNQLDNDDVSSESSTRAFTAYTATSTLPVTWQLDLSAVIEAPLAVDTSFQVIAVPNGNNASCVQAGNALGDRSGNSAPAARQVLNETYTGAEMRTGVTADVTPTDDATVVCVVVYTDIDTDNNNAQGKTITVNQSVTLNEVV